MASPCRTSFFLLEIVPHGQSSEYVQGLDLFLFAMGEQRTPGLKQKVVPRVYSLLSIMVLPSTISKCSGLRGKGDIPFD